MSLLLEFHKNQAELYTPQNTIDQFQSAFNFCKHWLSGEQKFVIKTSGSTGSPKKIVLTREQLEASARNLGGFIGYKAHDQMHIAINVDSIGGLMQIVRAMCYQMNIYVYEPKINVLERLDVEEGQKAHISLVSPMIDYIVKSDKNKINQFSTILVGGSKLTEMDLSGINTHIYETYGMTETASNVALRNITNGENSFKLLPNWSMKLHHDNCLALFHPYITTDWIYTNDIIEVADDLSFKILGRSDFVINSGGKKYYPEQIKNVLSSESFLTNIDFEISAEPNDIWHQSVVLVLSGGTSYLIDKEIIEQANKLLGFPLIRKIVRVTQFPSTSSGKLDRMQLMKDIAPKN